MRAGTEIHYRLPKWSCLFDRQLSDDSGRETQDPTVEFVRRSFDLLIRILIFGMVLRNKVKTAEQ